jgi:hypothetical protein
MRRELAEVAIDRDKWQNEARKLQLDNEALMYPVGGSFIQVKRTEWETTLEEKLRLQKQVEELRRESDLLHDLCSETRTELLDLVVKLEEPPSGQTY